jgi:hypothetical protein
MDGLPVILGGAYEALDRSVQKVCDIGLSEGDSPSDRPDSREIAFVLEMRRAARQDRDAPARKMPRWNQKVAGGGVELPEPLATATRIASSKRGMMIPPEEAEDSSTITSGSINGSAIPPASAGLLMARLKTAAPIAFFIMNKNSKK